MEMQGEEVQGMRSHGDFPTFLFYERVCVDTPYSVATSNPTHRGPR